MKISRSDEWNGTGERSDKEREKRASDRSSSTGVCNAMRANGSSQPEYEPSISNFSFSSFSFVFIFLFFFILGEDNFKAKYNPTDIQM